MSKLNIKDGDYVKLRDGSILGPVSRKSGGHYPISCVLGLCWTAVGKRYGGVSEDSTDIIEVLPGKPVFIDTPFEVGKTYRRRDGAKLTVTGFALILENGIFRYLDGSTGSFCKAGGDLIPGAIGDLIPGAIEDEEQVTVTMPKADYDRAMELLADYDRAMELLGRAKA